MSFFNSDEKKPLVQKSLTFNSINGLNYTENGKIIIEIPGETAQFFDPEQSYLKWNVKIDTNSPAKNYLCQLDAFLGSAVLIKDVRIYNLQGVLLEELVNVNTLSNVMSQYSDTLNNQKKHGLTTGQVLHNPEQRTWAPNNVRIEKSRETNTQYNPWFRKDNIGNATYNTVACCIKLPSAIFSSRRIWANEIFGGLRVEIILEQNKNCFKLFRNATPQNITNAVPDTVDSYYLPVIDHVNAGNEATGFPGGAAPNATEIFLGWKNNMCQTQMRCPFCVGEVIRIADPSAPGAFVEGTIAKIEWVNFSGAKYQIRLTMEGAGVVAPGANIDAGTPIYSDSFNQRGAGNDPSYLVSDVSMVIQQVMPEPSYISAMEKAMRENGGLSYKCHAWQNYRHSVTANENTATANVNILQRMAKALMVVPTNQTPITLADAIVEYGGSRTGISGVGDTLSSLQYFYSQKFQPDRPIGTELTSNPALEVFNGEYLCELEKALAFFGVPASHTLLNIKTNLVYPRALALMNQAVNLTEGDFQVIANYSNPTVAKLLNCWVAGIREFKATPEGVVVTY